MFCRDMGWKDDEDAVEAREGVCNMTDMLLAAPWGCSSSRLDRRPGPKPLEESGSEVSAPPAIALNWSRRSVTASLWDAFVPGEGKLVGSWTDRSRHHRGVRFARLASRSAVRQLSLSGSATGKIRLGRRCDRWNSDEDG